MQALKSRVLLPSKITLLSNGRNAGYAPGAVLLPSKITLLSNVDSLANDVLEVLLPSKITLLSNGHEDRAAL